MAASVSRRRQTGFPRARRVFRCGIFPETANDRPQVGQDHSPILGKKSMVTALQAYAMRAVNHALVRDRAVAPRLSARVRVRSRQSQPESIRAFRHRQRDSPPSPASVPDAD